MRNYLSLGATKYYLVLDMKKWLISNEGGIWSRAKAPSKYPEMLGCFKKYAWNSLVSIGYERTHQSSRYSYVLFFVFAFFGCEWVIFSLSFFSACFEVEGIGCESNKTGAVGLSRICWSLGPLSFSATNFCNSAVWISPAPVWFPAFSPDLCSLLFLFFNKL